MPRLSRMVIAFALTLLFLAALITRILGMLAASQVMISTFGGALIGGLTNVLALWYMFHRLIPGKKRSMAAAVERVISTELMSPDKVRAKLEAAETRTAIRDNVAVVLDTFLAKPLPSLGGLLAESDTGHADLFNGLREGIATEVFQRLRSETFRDTVVTPFLHRQRSRLLQQTPAQLVPDVVQEVLTSFPGWVAGNVDDKAVRSKVVAWVLAAIQRRLQQGGSVGSSLPPSVTQMLHKAVREGSDALTDRLIDVLRENAVQEALVQTVLGAVKAELSKPGMKNWLKGVAFDRLGIDDDIRRICGDLPNHLQRQMGRVNEPPLAATLEHFLIDLLDADTAEFAGRMDLSMLEPAGHALLNEVLDAHLTAHMAADGQRLLRDLSQKDITALLGQGASDTVSDGIVSSVAAQIQKALVSDDGRHVVLALLEDMQDRLLATPIGQLNAWVSDRFRARILDMVVDDMTRFAADRVEEFTHQAGIWDIITESIMDYDEAEMERLVRSVADRELRVMIDAGYLLGGAAGLALGLLLLLLA